MRNDFGITEASLSGGAPLLGSGRRPRKTQAPEPAARPAPFGAARPARARAPPHKSPVSRCALPRTRRPPNNPPGSARSMLTNTTGAAGYVMAARRCYNLGGAYAKSEASGRAPRARGAKAPRTTRKAGCLTKAYCAPRFADFGRSVPAYVERSPLHVPAFRARRLWPRRDYILEQGASCKQISAGTAHQ